MCFLHRRGKHHLQEKTIFTCSKILHNSRQTLHFLRDKGFNEISVRKLFSPCPMLLRSSFEGIVKPKVEFLERIGLAGQKLLQALSRNRCIFHLNVSRTLERKASFLQSVLDAYLAAVVSNTESGKIAGPSPDFHKIDGKVIFSHSLTASVILKNPRVLSLSEKTLVGIVKDVEGMGIEKGSKAFARAFLHLSWLNKDTVNVKLENLRELGFTEEDVCILVKRYPRLLGISKDKLRQNLKFLDEEWKLPRNAIMSFPAVQCSQRLHDDEQVFRESYELSSSELYFHVRWTFSSQSGEQATRRAMKTRCKDWGRLGYSD